MPRPRNPHPKMIHDRSSGQASCWFTDPITGKRRGVRLGPWGSVEAEQAHARLLAEIRTGSVRQSAPAAGVTVAELCARFAAYARSHYGPKSSEFAHFRSVLATLADRAGETPAVRFGPGLLKAVREDFIRRGWQRQTVNDQTRRVRAVFRWAVGEELVPAGVWQAMTAVPGLGRGRTPAPERKAIQPAPLRAVARALRRMPPAIAAMCRFLWLTGCRPQDACHLRVEDLDRTRDVWVYRPPLHKGAWRGKIREVYVGPKAQALLGPWLDRADGTGYLFSPVRETGDRNARRSESRQTPRYPSHMRRNAEQRTRLPRRPPRVCYSTGSFGRAVARACDQAGVEPWTPLQLRHSAGTRFRERFGLELTRVLLGHDLTSTSEIYAEKPRRQAAEAMRKVG